jgi:hypothetical protein
MQGLFKKYFIGIYPDGIADIVSAFPRRKKTPQSCERGVQKESFYEYIL